MRTGVVVCAAVILASASVAVALRQDNPRQLANEAAQRIRQLQKEADGVAATSSSMLNELRRLELQRQIKVEEVKKADAELADVLVAIERASARLAALEAERLQEAPWVRQRLVELYKRGRVGNLRLLLSTEDLRAMARMSRGVAAVAELDRVRLSAHRATLRQQRDTIRELETHRASAQAARAAAQSARLALEQAVAANNRRLDELDRQRDLAARYIGELQAAQSELQRSVAALPGNAAALPLAPFRGTLDWPVAGRILSRFGRSTADRFGSTVSRNGIEIATAEGVAVRTIHAGTVAYAAPFTGFGTLVIVDHGQNAFSLYGHLSQATVTNGTRVGRNDVIGRAGRTPDGIAAAYFELRIDGRPVDPVQWLRSQR
jgi:septal ring factor EnvC (AmiA/AmiB activator)